MADNLTKNQRSYIMSRIRSRWTNQERRLHGYLKSRKIKHSMHPKITGNPDLVLKVKKVAVFLDGCFWHRCPKCFRMPSSRTEYWEPKIKNNVKRDRMYARNLKNEGWYVIRFWEHQIIENPTKCVEEMISYLEK